VVLGGLAREQRCNAPIRISDGSRSLTSLTTTARTLSWGFMRRVLALAELAGGSALQVLELALRQVRFEPLLELGARAAGPPSGAAAQVVEPAPHLVSLHLLLLELCAQLVRTRPSCCLHARCTPGAAWP